MKKFLSLLLLLGLIACNPATETAPTPDGYSVSLSSCEGFNCAVVDVAEPVSRAYLVLVGEALAENADECEVVEGEIRCVIEGGFSESYSLPYGGTVTGAAAFVCGVDCYAFTLE